MSSKPTNIKTFTSSNPEKMANDKAIAFSVNSGNTSNITPMQGTNNFLILDCYGKIISIVLHDDSVSELTKG
jgi:hypothetical protein